MPTIPGARFSGADRTDGWLHIPDESTVVKHLPEIVVPVSVNQQVFQSRLIHNGGESRAAVFKS